ncbi:MAG: hypothetical protein ACJ71Q_12850 [Terriglobales bacterium]
MALAQFDETVHGGNGDGVIDRNDAIFDLLRLWQDRNHDGISQPDELHSLSELGVEAIYLDYKAENRRDEYGNMFRFRSVVIGHDPVTGHEYRRFAYDVFLLGDTKSAKSFRRNKNGFVRAAVSRSLTPASSSGVCSTSMRFGYW